MKSLPVEPKAPDLAIGRRLRALREQRRLTLSQISELSGFSKGFLSRIERDLTSPSVQTLLTLCQILGVTPGQILDAVEPSLVRVEDAPLVDLGGRGIEERLVTPRGQRSLQILYSTLSPGGSGEDDLYTVDCEVEAIHVVKGSFTLITQGEEIPLTEGDTLTIPGTESHTWRNDTDHDAVVLWILSGSKI